ncbi:virion structural protein [Cellulophaga phage phi14:2]|uniref:Structural protein n=1 Tax=Cellulophaga phage phi14:2 TaxID=1327990 RepID=S0A064_9CAUD|nr:virion structural protein [Cellulophaga phage phi14:2]AGO48969.1 structural protein [Cellulophaga phage phi14:2]
MAQFLITTNSKLNLPPSQIGTGQIITFNRIDTTFTEYNFKNTIPIYVDPDGDDIEAVKILTLPSRGLLQLNGVNCTVNQEINFSDVIAGNFKWTSEDVDASYNTSFTFDLSDVGSSTFSGLTTGLMTKYVGPYVNLQPTSVGDNSDEIDYNTTRVFTVADFTTDTTPAYSDPEGDAAEQLKITVVPTQGSLKFNGISVTVNQIINFSDIALGKLTFTADGNTNGYNTSFNFEVADAGSKKFTA